MTLATPDDLDDVPDAGARLAAELARAVPPREEAAPRQGSGPENRTTDTADATMNHASNNPWADVPPPGDDDRPGFGGGASPDPAPLFSGPPEPGFFVEDPPPFPVGALPDWLAAWVWAAADATGASVDVAATVALGVLSWAAAWSPRDTPMRGAWGAMTAPLVLYTCAVEESGTNKSGVFKLALAPLRSIERELVENSKASRAEEAARHDAAQAKVNAIKASLDGCQRSKSSGKPWKGDSADALRDALATAHEELAEAPAPLVPRVVMDDATAEAMVKGIASVPVACLATPEGHEVFELAAGRYSKGPSFAALLKAFDGDPIRVSRILRDGDDLDNPLMSIAITTQPVTLRRLAAMPGDFASRGLSGRIFWSWPRTVLGWRSSPTGSVGVPGDVVGAYERGVRGLFATRPGTTADGKPLPVRLGPEACALADVRHNANEVRMREGGDLKWCSSMVSKTRTQFLRLAVILHLADGRSPSEVVGPDAMRRALLLDDYFLAMGLRAWRAMEDGDEPATAKVWRILSERAEPLGPGDGKTEPSNPAHFVILSPPFRGLTKRDLQRMTQRTVTDAAHLDAVLGELASAGYVAVVDRRRLRGSGQRPSPWVVLNPDAPTGTAPPRTR